MIVHDYYNRKNEYRELSLHNELEDGEFFYEQGLFHRVWGKIEMPVMVKLAFEM